MLNIIADVLLIILSGDELYLYAVGQWYDPNLVIEHIEVVLLAITLLFALVKAGLDIRALFRNHHA